MNFANKKTNQPNFKFGKKIPGTELYYDDIKVSMSGKEGLRKELQLFNGKNCVATFGVYSREAAWRLKFDKTSFIMDPNGEIAVGPQTEEVKKFFDLLINKYEQKEEKKQKFTFGKKLVENKKPGFTFGNKVRE